MAQGPDATGGRPSALGFLSAFALLVLVAGAEEVQALDLEIVAGRDNTLYYDLEGGRSNGAGSDVFAGNTAGGEPRRALLWFDLDGVVPEGVVVTSASVQLFMNRTASAAQPMALHRLLADWGEGVSVAPGEAGGGGSATTGDATWLHRHFPAELWDVPGGDFVALPSAEAEIGEEGFYVFSSPALVADVRGWLADPASNAGWVLIGNESIPRTAKRFTSRQAFPTSGRPRLLLRIDDPADAEPGPDGGAGGFAHPNPFRERVELRWSVGEPASGRVLASNPTVVDAAGRVVRRLALPGGTAEEGLVATWDGLDGSGAAVPAGVYWVRFEPTGLPAIRLVHLR